MERAKNQLRYVITVEGGTCVWGDEAEVRIREAALSRTEEECQPTVCGVRAGEPLPAAEKTAASRPGLTPAGLPQVRPPQRKQDRQPHPIAGTSRRNVHGTKTQAYSEFP